MSLHISVISIEGDHLNEIADILREREYTIKDTFVVHTGAQAGRELDWNPDPHHVAKAAYLSEGWTFVVDPELVMISDDLWLQRSQKWNNRVFAWICEGASGSYGFMVFDSGKKRRHIFVSDGTVVEEYGAPLVQEENIDWNTVGEEDVLALAQRMGAEYDYFADREYIIFHLGEA